MKCEECNCVMQWRSTNKVTNLSKFKCPNCGHVQIGENKVTYHVGLPVEEKPKRVPKYYHCKDGRYIVKRRINKKLLYAGSYADEAGSDIVIITSIFEIMSGISYNITVFKFIERDICFSLLIDSSICYIFKCL